MPCPSHYPTPGNFPMRSSRRCDCGPSAAASWATPRPRWPTSSAWLRSILVPKRPQDLGIPAPRWTRPAVRDLIRRGSGIDMPVWTVGEYLRRWGFTPEAPRRHARDQDPEEVRRWIDEEDPAIERRAAREGAVILWRDEA